MLLLALCWPASAALPKRLILAVDGVSFRDVQALQQGVAADNHVPNAHRRAFTNGYFPVSRLVSSFPSTTDTAWTEIFGDHPLPGYQRTYFNQEANAMVFVNGVTSSMEFERQMTWRIQGGFAHAMSYLFPGIVFGCELRGLRENFLAATNSTDNFYGYICVTDAAQHMGINISTLLCRLDEELQRLRLTYRQREGRELEILLLSDHGNDHAGPGRRVAVRSLLRKNGYRAARSILTPKDVVLPTVGIESWVEVHNLPSETEGLLPLLSKLKGADILTAMDPHARNRFIICNGRGERAVVDWNVAANRFRYSVQTGDPLGYEKVVEELRSHHELDAGGFGSADDWMKETIGHKYPLAIERIARAHTKVTQNPATILISLKPGFVHAGWGVKTGSRLMSSGGTHGSLQDVSSTGILLSTFAPTFDTSTGRVASLFDRFPGLHELSSPPRGAEWVRAQGPSPRPPIR